MVSIASLTTVAHRELREGARRPLNYWLRLGGAAGAALLLAFNTERARSLDVTTGINLFLRLHALLLAWICFLVPAMAADTIALEKREGTLGLLLMTPLSAGGIVMGKALTLAFRAFTLWLAVLPVLVIPFLSGGVAWGDVASAVTMQFSLGVLCLAAGLLASALVKSRVAAFAAAFGLAVMLIIPFAWSLSLMKSGLGNFPGIAERLITGMPDYFGKPVVTQSYSTFVLTYTPAGVASPMPGVPFGVAAPGGSMPVFFTAPAPGVPGPATVLIGGLGWSTLFAGGVGVSWRLLLAQCWLVAPLVFLVALRFASRAVAATWKDDLPSPRKDRLLKRYCTPLWRRWTARRMNRTLDLNPIIWLQEYSWKARLMKWGPCLLVGVIDANAIADDFDGFEAVLRNLLILLAALMTLAGVSSFLAEKRSGALELILVTPLRPNEIVFGRVWGLWKLVLPTAVMLVVTGFARLSIGDGHSQGMGSAAGSFFADLTLAAIFFLNLPLFSTYFALRHKSPVVAALMTWIVLLAPLVCSYALVTFGNRSVYRSVQGVPLDSPLGIGMVLALTFIASVGMFVWGWMEVGQRLSLRAYET